MKATNTNFVALDIGSSKISVVAAQLENNGEARIGYQSIFQSSGIRAGHIHNFNNAENSIVTAVYNLEKEIDKNVSSVSISISGIGSKSFYIYNKVRLIDGKVTQAVINSLISQTLEKIEKSENTIIHYFPIEYTLDQNNSINNPLGMFGNILGCRLHVVIADSSQITNILNCFAKCNISVKEILIGQYAAGLAVLTEDEKSLGSLVLDFGSDTTSYAIFSSGQLLYTGFAPFGGNHITSDIAKILSISIPSAEKLKVLYGSALASNNDSDNMINLSEIEPSSNFDEDINITANDLSMIIAARAEEIVELIKNEYDRIGIDHLIGRRIVLTGGGAQLRGMKEIIAGAFKKQVRIGNPFTIPGFESDHTTSSFCSVLGLVKNEMVQQKKSTNLRNISSSILTKIASWLRDSP